MTRKTTQLPKANPGDYDRWRKAFDSHSVRTVLAKFEPAEAESIHWLLFVAQFDARPLPRGQASRIFPKLEVHKRISLMDYVIAWIASRLKDKRPKDKKTHRDNADVATLLTAAGISVGRSGEGGWSPEAVKKRRERVGDLWVSIWGPRFQLRRLSRALAIAREPDVSNSLTKVSTARDKNAEK
jgi:hypothetical protein